MGAEEERQDRLVRMSNTYSGMPWLVSSLYTHIYIDCVILRHHFLDQHKICILR